MAVVLAFVTISCSKSNSDYLKESTVKCNEWIEKLNAVKDAEELRDLGVEISKLGDNWPKELQEMSEEDICNIEGGKEFIDAFYALSEASDEAAERVATDKFQQTMGTIDAAREMIEQASNLEE